RRSQVQRKKAGKEQSAQVICANVTKVLVVTAVGRDLNARRLERYLSAVLESGAQPIIVVNKADLPCDKNEILAEIASVAEGVPVYWVSAIEDNGWQSLAPLLQRGETLVLVGSSGVGKSTLANRLLGESRQSTAEGRERDGRGRHTAARREP